MSVDFVNKWPVKLIVYKVYNIVCDMVIKVYEQDKSGVIVCVDYEGPHPE